MKLQGVRTRQTLPQPALPELFAGGSDITIEPVYEGEYGERVEEARKLLKENQLLREKLRENVSRADRNQYNLEVLLSLAEFSSHHEQMVISMKEIEDELQYAAVSDEPEEALDHLVSAYQQANRIIRDRRDTFKEFKAIWEKSRYPRMDGSIIMNWMI